MEAKTGRLVEGLARSVSRLPQPVHLLSVWSGGKAVSHLMARHLRKQGVRSDTFWVKTDLSNGRAKLVDTNFHAKDYKGTAVIVEDAIWKGRNLPPIRKILRKMRPGRRVYVAALLDYNRRADFSVFH